MYVLLLYVVGNLVMVIIVVFLFEWFVDLSLLCYVFFINNLGMVIYNWLIDYSVIIIYKCLGYIFFFFGIICFYLIYRVFLFKVNINSSVIF